MTIACTRTVVAGDNVARGLDGVFLKVLSVEEKREGHLLPLVGWSHLSSYRVAPPSPPGGQREEGA